MPALWLVEGGSVVIGGPQPTVLACDLHREAVAGLSSSVVVRRLPAGSLS